MGRRENRTQAVLENSIAGALGIRERARVAASWLLDDPERAMAELVEIHQWADELRSSLIEAKDNWYKNGQPDILTAGWRQGELEW